MSCAVPGEISTISNRSPGSSAAAASAGTLKPRVAALNEFTSIGKLISRPSMEPQLVVVTRPSFRSTGTDTRQVSRCGRHTPWSCGPGATRHYGWTMRHAHTVEQVRTAEAALLARLPEG